MSASAKVETKLQVRLPADLHRELRLRADASERSLNGEIVYALKRYVAATAMDDERRLREALARADRGERLATVTQEDLAAIRREIEALAVQGVTGGVSPTLERLRREAGDLHGLSEPLGAG
jgi:hypothetical protein